MKNNEKSVKTNEKSMTYRSILQRPDVCGVLLNIGPGQHWTCIVTHGDHAFYVDSKQFPPNLIQEQDFQSILARHPDAYFVLSH